MNIFGFGGYIGALSHCIRFHLEMNTYFSWFDYYVEYDESLNGCRMCLEFCKIQLTLMMGSCVNDFWNFDSSSYLVRENHHKLTQEEIEEMEYMAQIQDEDFE